MSDLPKIAFRIRRQYFDAIKSGEKTDEVRRFSTYWCRQVARLLDDDMGRCGIAVFICGKDIHRRMIVGVNEFQNPEEALGRAPSAQGLKDIGDGDGPVLSFLLGEEIL